MTEFKNSQLFKQKQAEGVNVPPNTDNPHSSLVFLAVEQGLIGVAILILLMGGLFVSSLACIRNRPELLGLSGGVIGLGIYGIFNTIELSGFTVALMATLVIFAIPRPLPEAQAGSDPTG